MTSTEIVEVIPPGEYVPSVVMTTQQAVELIAAVEDAKRNVMRNGVDYAKIPGTPKPSLLKPGAERLGQLFGFGHVMGAPLVECDPEGRPHRVTIRCDVTKHGEVIASSWGSCDYDEDRYAKAAREQSETPETGEIIPGRKAYRAPWNTLLKMADKRAYVGAMLKATASSGLFTQDLDAEPERPARKTRARQEPTTDPQMITAEQRSLMFQLFGYLGMTNRDVRLKYAAAVVNRDLGSSNELTKREASKVIDLLQRDAEKDARSGGGKE